MLVASSEQKRLIVILLVLAIIFLFAISAVFVYQKNQPKFLEVDFMDVGQGDAILIKTPDKQNILIDGGPDETVLERLGENMNWFDRRIDLMILTHPHADHLTGQIEVLKRYQVQKVIYTGATHSSPNYLEWLEALKQSRAKLLIAEKYQKINIQSDLYLEVLYPEAPLAEENLSLNNTSIVLRLVHGGNKFLFMGDAEEAVEQRLLERYDMKSQVIKIGHHGSKTSSQDFLYKVKPEISVISVGKDNAFGHPAAEALRAIGETGSKIYRTDRDGTITLLSTGKEILAK